MQCFTIEPNGHPTLLDTGLEKVNSINLTWSDQELVPVPLVADIMMRVFKLTISHGPSSEIISVSDSSYCYTAPKGEVYNFSVTATYVGAMYTGTGCNKPSPVLSRMLPSLPSINRMESSINCSLKKDGKIFLSLSFKV